MKIGEMTLDAETAHALGQWARTMVEEQWALKSECDRFRAERDRLRAELHRVESERITERLCRELAIVAREAAYDAVCRPFTNEK